MAKSIAEQDLAEMGGSRSVLARQRRDHVKLDLLLRELGDRSGAAQEEALRKVCRLVFPHGFAEEAVLWPALRRSLPDGHELTLDVEQEHQEINELVKSLEHGEPRDQGRQQVIDRLIEVLRQDVRDEEDVLLPRLQEAVSAEQLRRLGVVWELVRRIAPTRPHPVISRRPPATYWRLCRFPWWTASKTASTGSFGAPQARLPILCAAAVRRLAAPPLGLSM